MTDKLKREGVRLACIEAARHGTPFEDAVRAAIQAYLDAPEDPVWPDDIIGVANDIVSGIEAKSIADVHDAVCNALMAERTRHQPHDPLDLKLWKIDGFDRVASRFQVMLTSRNGSVVAGTGGTPTEAWNAACKRTRGE